MDMDIDNMLSTTDISALLSGGFGDEDNTPTPKANGGIRDDVDDLPSLKNYDEDGQEYDVDFNSMFGDEDEDLDQYADDLVTPYEAEEVAEAILINGERFERSDVEKMVEYSKEVSDYVERVHGFGDTLQAESDKLDRFYSIGASEFDAMIEYYSDLMEQRNITPADYKDAHSQVKMYQARKRELESTYNEAKAATDRLKAEREQLTGINIRNNLIRKGWKQADFAEMAGYLQSNNMLDIPLNMLSEDMMIAIRKAALYDAKDKAVKADVESKVTKAIRGTAKRSSDPVMNSQAADNRKKNKLKAQLKNTGYANHVDMFDFLDD